MHRYSVSLFIYLDKEAKNIQIKSSSQHFTRVFFFFIRLANFTYLRNLDFVSQNSAMPQTRYLITCIGGLQDSLRTYLGKRWSERALEQLWLSPTRS